MAQAASASLVVVVMAKLKDPRAFYNEIRGKVRVRDELVDSYFQRTAFEKQRVDADEVDRFAQNFANRNPSLARLEEALHAANRRTKLAALSLGVLTPEEQHVCGVLGISHETFLQHKQAARDSQRYDSLQFAGATKPYEPRYEPPKKHEPPVPEWVDPIDADAPALDQLCACWLIEAVESDFAVIDATAVLP